MMKNLIEDELLKKKLLSSFTVFIIFSCIAFFGWYILNQNSFLSSDMSSELLLAKCLSEENRFVTPNWYYSTEVRILNTQLVMMPLFKLFKDWTLVRALGNIILYCIYIGGGYYLLRKIEIGRAWSLFFSGLLIVPFSDYQILMVLIGSYYIPHVFLICIILGLIISLINDECKKWKKIFFSAVCILLTFISGMGGIRYLLLLAVPIFLTTVWTVSKSEEFLMIKNNDKFDYRLFKNFFLSISGKLLIAAAGIVVLSGIGYIVNEAVLSKIFSFTSYNTTKFINTWNASILDRANDILVAVLQIAGWSSGVEVFSLRGIGNLFILLNILFTICFIYDFLKRSNEVPWKSAFFVRFTVAAFLINGFVFLSTGESFTDRYYGPVLVLFILVWAVLLKNQKSKLYKVLFVFVVSGSILFRGVISMQELSKHTGPTYLDSALTYLEENNLVFGYASFWNANIITELSNGEIEIANIWNPQSMEPYFWLTPKKYYNDNYHQGRCFILLTKEEDMNYSYCPVLQNGKKKYEDDKYVIYEYDSTADIKNILME